MRKKIVKLTESDLERLVKRVIKEEENESAGKKTTLTKHPAYNIIDKLEDSLEGLKREFKTSIANAVSGEDGYHSEIDKFSSEFTNFIGKLEKLKQKINDHQVSGKEKEKADNQKRMEERKKYQQYMKDQAMKKGRNYSY
jgi:hypothetical protein